ncbi:MAG: FAD-dependent oxidoreductase, partial [Lachnospiraceae bacterium]|nr:FAD-dependent oxidoreductase [Lachnospiraceae bacterium]
MIRISELKLPYDHDEAALLKKIRKKLNIKDDNAFEYTIAKRSLDARKKPELYYIYTVDVKTKDEKKILKKIRDKDVREYVPVVYRYETDQEYATASAKVSEKTQPVVVGAGPAGLFAALLLAEHGLEPLLIERGKSVDERTADVEAFWNTGLLNPGSNVQFGEGGAGTFSDGKLSTGVNDKSGRNAYVLKTFVKYGADPDILYDFKPHIGTDVLKTVVKNIRNDIIRLGGTVRFNTALTGLDIESGTEGSRHLKGIFVNETEYIPCEKLVLAIGHSARDTFEMIRSAGLPMEQKNFACGFRVEHPQSLIDRLSYGDADMAYLSPASYKLTYNGKRPVYSFCMCPGGYVVNASSGEDQTVVNGMSYRGRDSGVANSAIVVGVVPADYGSSDVLAGVRFQERLEKAVFDLGGGAIARQLYGDYRENRTSTSYGAFEGAVKGRAVLSNLRGLFPEEMENEFMSAMSYFDGRLKGFAGDDVILSGVESRTSSPVRILRGEDLQSDVRGVLPCGEGCGYAGGIVSAAIDGLKVAEEIIGGTDML